MNKSKELLKARREHIKNRVNNAISTVKEVTKISKELFLSESTIYKDLKHGCKDENTNLKNA